MEQGHREGPVSPVVDDDIAFGGMVEMGEGGRAFILVAEEVDVYGHAAVQPIEGADHALAVVGTVVRGAGPRAQQFPRQGDLRSVDSEDAVSLPQGIVGTVGEDLPCAGS